MEGKDFSISEKSGRTKKILYVILSVVLNILLSIGGYWSILIGLFCMEDSWFSPKSKSLTDIIFGLCIYLGIYFVTAALNLLLYLILRKRAELTWKWFWIPVSFMVITGIIYTIVLHM